MRTHAERQAAGAFVALLILSLVASGFPATATAKSDAEALAEDTEQTTPPEETTPPDETEPPTDGDGTEAPQEELTPSEVPVWTWVLAGLVLVGAIAWMITRSGSGSNGAAGDGGGA